MAARDVFRSDVARAVEARCPSSACGSVGMRGCSRVVEPPRGGLECGQNAMLRTYGLAPARTTSSEGPSPDSSGTRSKCPRPSRDAISPSVGARAAAESDGGGTPDRELAIPHLPRYDTT